MRQFLPLSLVLSVSDPRRWAAADVNCTSEASPPAAHPVSPHAVSVVMETDAAAAERMTSPPASSSNGQVRRRDSVKQSRA